MSHPDSAGFRLFASRKPSGQIGPMLLALLAGALQAASLAWPWSTPGVPGFLGLLNGHAVWWVQWLAMLVLVRLLLHAGSATQAAWRAWCFALAWLSLSFGWLYISLHTYGDLPALLALLALLALAGALALYYAFACGCFKALALANKAHAALVFAAFWLLAELARGQWLSGFGWGAVGYSQLDGPLVDLIAWVGVYGVGFVAALLAALGALLLNAASRRQQLVCGLSVVMVLLGVTHLPATSGGSQGMLSVTLLQGNIAQEEKFQPSTGIARALRWYGAQLQASRSALTITPETALAVLPEQLPPGYWLALQRRFATGTQAALVGIPLGDDSQGYTNSVVGFKPGQSRPWRYDKHHLVPFGEFIPPFFRWFTDLLHIPLGDFNRGDLAQPTFDWHGQRLATSICYENLFGEELASQFTDPALAPTILVNISNLGWFGEHQAMDQHLQMTRMRALEFDRPFLLATNTGRTAIVNHLGQITDAAAPHSLAVLQGQVEGRTGLTPYAYWVARCGLLPLWALALLLAAGALAVKRSNSSTGSARLNQ